MGGGLQPLLVLENFRQEVYSIRQLLKVFLITSDKSFIKSGLYNPTKRSILKSFNGSVANVPIPGNC